MKNKKYPNFQDLYPFSDYKKAVDAMNTFECGLSPVCLLAPNQHTTISKSVIEEESGSAILCIRTLRLEYAIQVWLKAALISEENPGPLLYYWWLHYEDNDTSFRELQYSNFWCDATPEGMIDGFWKLLENIANSGEIKVSEGYSCTTLNREYCGQQDIQFNVVLDIDNANNADKLIKDVYTHPYKKEPKTYSWEEIKDLFTQLTLKQLSLMNKKCLHKHSKIDEMLFCACSQLDFEGVKTAVRMGANVNALDDMGESALQHAIEYFDCHGLNCDQTYSEEESQAIKDDNYKKCIKIVDYLLEQGADIDLYGTDGLQPLACAYYARNIDMIKHLLEKGSDPNYNSFRCDDVSHCDEDSNQCTILDVIAGLLSDEYEDYDGEVEKLIRKHGGRRFAWDWDIDRFEHIGKFYLEMSPDHKRYLFFDNDSLGIGDEQEIEVENGNGEKRTIKLDNIPGLREWHEEYLQNLEKEGYDWNAWSQKGYELARLVAKQLPEDVALFYPYGDEVQRKVSYWGKDHYLKTLDEKIRIV